VRKQALLNLELIVLKQILQCVSGSTYKQNNPVLQVLSDDGACCLSVQKPDMHCWREKSKHQLLLPGSSVGRRPEPEQDL